MLLLAQNSIRHNLSIRKGMFTKVHQYPPRRGNGSYWTLLPEGEEELKRAIPLFSTLQPPVIDEQSVYNHMPSTYKLKSKGQFVPVVPNSCSPVKPYFAVGTHPWSQSSSEHDYHHSDTTDQDISDCCTFDDSRLLLCKRPHHLTSDSSPCSSDERSPAPKRRKRQHSLDLGPPPSTSRHTHVQKKPVPGVASHDLRGSSHDLRGSSHDLSLDLLNTSFLSPVKDFFADVDLDPIALSPLFNIVSPKRATSYHTPLASFPLPSFTPLKPHPPTEGDSGVFSPLRLEGLMFSTPLRSSDIMCDLPTALSTPHHDDIFSIRPLGTPCHTTAQELMGCVMSPPWEKLDPETV